MTTASPGHKRIARLTGEEFRALLPEALSIYVAAMNYPPNTAQQRAPMWLTHALRPGWRGVAAFDTDDTLIGVAYGYRGSPGQWWYEQVRRGLLDREDEETALSWLSDYFELTEIHVRPDHHGRGLGETLLRALLDGVPQRHVLLSTPEGPSRAWRLYRRLGFADVLRDYRFVGDPRPFAVLGRALPLD